MAITLEELKVGQLPDLDKAVIDEFTKGDFLFQNIPFDTIANPVAGGGGWTAAYLKVKEEASTDFRDINGKYEETQAKREQKSVDVKVFGGKFSIDRALRDQGGVEKEVAFQLSQLVKATKKGFSYYLIKGDKTTAKQFDGLAKLVDKSSTDVSAGEIDLSTFEKIKLNAMEFVSVLDNFLSLLDEKPDCLLMNKTLKNKILTTAKFLGLATMTQDEVGKVIESYNGIPLIALETYKGQEAIDIEKTKNVTSLYAVKFGGDGLVLASPSTGNIIEVIAPDFTQATEQVTGMVELRAVPMLRNSKKCGVLKNIKVK